MAVARVDVPHRPRTMWSLVRPKDAGAPVRALLKTYARARRVPARGSMHGEGGIRRGGTRASIGLLLVSLLVPLLGATSAQAAAPVLLLFNPLTCPVGT